MICECSIRMRHQSIAATHNIEGTVRSRKKEDGQKDGGSCQEKVDEGGRPVEDDLIALDVMLQPCCGEGRYGSEEQPGCGKIRCCCVEKKTGQRQTRSS